MTHINSANSTATECFFIYGLTTVPSRRRTFPQRISKGGSSVMGNFAAAFSSGRGGKDGFDVEDA
jgi:hypothetical protein